MAIARALTPYTPDQYSPNECVYFRSAQSWEGRESKLINGAKRLEFTDEFNVTDAHLDAIISIGPSFCHSLQDFRAGDAETGKGASLSDAVILRLTRACPNIVHVGLDVTTQLTDEPLLALFTNCANIRYVQLSGNDRIAGALRGPALDVLRDTHDMGKKLVKLRLTDQTEFYKGFTIAVKALSAARKKLAIEVGNTHERDGGVNIWLGGKEKHGYQVFGGRGGFDSYGGYGNFGRRF